MPVTADAIYRSLLLDKRTPLKIRLQSLQAMTRPSLRLLYQLSKDKSLRVRFEAAKLLAIELTRKEMRKRAKERSSTTNRQ
jgi:hypothetical protein